MLFLVDSQSSELGKTESVLDASIHQQSFSSEAHNYRFTS